jgi:hypothetical protein
MYRICAASCHTPFALSVARAKSKGERHERTNLEHELCVFALPGARYCAM